MAKHLLQGEISFYASGHSYSGSLISFLMAPLFVLGGATPFMVKLPALVLFLFFVCANYFFLKKAFSPATAFFGTLFVVFMPAGILDISIRAWGHAEIWFFQAIFLLVLQAYFDLNRPDALWLFLAGWAAGIGLWINQLSLLFILPVLIYFGLRQVKEPFFSFFAKVFWAKHPRLPGWLRVTLRAAHLFILVFLFVQPFYLHPPFRIKEMSKIVFSLASEAALLWLPAAVKPIGLAAAGFLMGNLLALLFNLLGGEGLRIFHKSGAIAPQLLIPRLHDIFLDKVPHFLLGAASPLSPAWLFPPIIILLIGFAGWHYRKIRTSYAPLFIFILIAALAANCLSSLEAKRYLVPCYFAIASLLGVFLGNIAWVKSKPSAVLISGLLIAHFLYGNVLFYRHLPENRAALYEQILAHLDRQNVRGGFGDRSVSHILTFLSGERLVLAATFPKERYLPYDDYANTLRRRAYVLEKGESSDREFRNNAGLMSKVKDTAFMGEFVIYVVEEPGTAGAADRRYPAWRPRQSVHFYVNEFTPPSPSAA